MPAEEHHAATSEASLTSFSKASPALPPSSNVKIMLTCFGSRLNVLTSRRTKSGVLWWYLKMERVRRDMLW